MEKKIGEKLKKMKQKFEVFRKAGKLFEEEKMRLHFKETTKVRRDTTLQILTAMKEPAMRYANRQPSVATPGNFHENRMRKYQFRPAVLNPNCSATCIFEEKKFHDPH